MRAYLGLTILIAVTVTYGKTELSPKIEEILRKRTIHPNGPSVTEEFLEPATVPDPEDGGRWWYAPSPRAELYGQKYRHQLQNELLMRENENLRLPGDLVPVIYNIRLLPFLDDGGNFTTDGHIDIFFDCVKSTSSININSAEIEVDRFSITVQHIASNNLIELAAFIDDQTTREMIEIQTKTELVAGNRYKISMNFVSHLNDQLRGFYRSSYIENGKRKWLAVTQMEAPDARRAFPCFDEPNMKAEFSVVLGRKKTMSTASNMLLLATYPMEGHDDYVWDHYQTTVKMSSYLVAFLVSEFTAVPAEPGHRVPFRLWVKPESQHLTGYSLRVGPAMQEFYEDYFKIPFPLPKQDLAAIPDFSAGAMENFGLITYRETRLLIDLEKDTRSLRQSIASINAHEIAHQWFGDLVTTDWWNTIWLNEGFATYVEFLGTEAVEPQLRFMDQFVNLELHYVFGIDALETSRPINLNVTTPSEIGRMFDGISYDKGACIIRMCANFMGLETFNRGLTRYLNARAYKNAVQDDLWQALQEQADEEGLRLPATVKEIMDTWTLQMGFPLITVKRNYDNWSATVTQSRFLVRKDPSSSDTHVYRWWVPLTFHSPSNTTEKFQWISDTEESITIQNTEALQNEWLIFNVDQKSVYRVAYDQLNYQLISKQLLTDHKVILDNNRAQLLDDAFVLASVDVIPYNYAMSLSAYLKNEVEWSPWNAVLGELNYVDNMLYTSVYHADWQIYLVGLVLPYYNSVGFEESPSDAHLIVYSRSDAMNWACRLRIEDCVANVKAKYAAFMANPSDDSILSPNQKSLILNYGVELGGTNEWNFAFEQYLSGNGAFLVPMTKTRQVNLLYQQLECMLNGTIIRTGDVRTLFNNIAANPVGNSIATNFLINRWADIEAALGNSYFADFFRYVCDRKNTQEELNQLIKLRDDHSDILGSSNTVKQGIEVVQSNIKWMESNPGEIAVWLGLIPGAPTVAPATVTSTTVAPTPTTIAPVVDTQTTKTPATPSPTPASNASINSGITITFISMLLLLFSFN